MNMYLYLCEGEEGGIEDGWEDWEKERHTQSADIMGGNLRERDRQSNCQAGALERNKEEQWRQLQWRSGVTVRCAQMTRSLDLGGGGLYIHIRVTRSIPLFTFINWYTAAERKRGRDEKCTCYTPIFIKSAMVTAVTFQWKKVKGPDSKNTSMANGIRWVLNKHKLYSHASNCFAV